MGLYKWDRGDLEFKPLGTRSIFLYILIIIFAVSVGAGIGAAWSLNSAKSIKLEQEELVLLLSETEKRHFKSEMVYEYLKELNAPFAHILYAQAVLESGNFKSDLFRKNNNCYGMKQPGNRPTTSMGENEGYASYQTWRDCILDRVIYNSLYLKDVKTESQYYQYLSNSGYAEDTLYIGKIKAIADRIKNEKD